MRLSAHGREIAPEINRILCLSREWAREASVAEVEKRVIEAINAVSPGEMKVEYYTIVDPVTMQHVDSWVDDARGCATVYVGDVRLIDNVKY